MKALFETIANALLENQISISDDVLPLKVAKQLQKEAIFDFDEGNFEKAKIGKGIEKQRISEIRGDAVRWLHSEKASEAQAIYWTFITELREFLSEFFRVHLERSELHFAVYPEGAFYARHFDQFQGFGNRIFSAILYLNENYKDGNGGELRAYHADGTFIDYPPLFNRFIIFRSDAVEHEVLETFAQRTSITGWLRKDKLIF